MEQKSLSRYLPSAILLITLIISISLLSYDQKAAEAIFIIPIQLILSLLLAGILLLMSVYFLMVYLLNYRKVVYLIFAGLCLTFFGATILKHLPDMIHAPSVYQPTADLLLAIFTLGGAYLFSLFFLYHFRTPFKLLFVSLLTGFIIRIFIQEEIMLNRLEWSLFYAYVVAFLSILIALFKKSRGSLEALLILGLCFISTFESINMFLSFSLLVCFSLFALSLKIREENTRYHQAQLRSARLETELLKKTIQPHFLMNSLATAISWFRESPNKGISFIEALGEELKILNQISNKKCIPIEKEIELCRSHLTVMSFRKERHYELKAEQIQPLEILPPALLHTVIENGITHLSNEQSPIVFTLIFEQTGRQKKYTIRSPFKPQNSKTIKEGTGFKYIKARLEESYPGNWRFDSKPKQGEWVTEITFQVQN